MIEKFWKLLTDAKPYFQKAQKTQNKSCINVCNIESLENPWQRDNLERLQKGEMNYQDVEKTKKATDFTETMQRKSKRKEMSTAL